MISGLNLPISRVSSSELLRVPQDEALVQYDELDALLTQFVLNSSVGATPPWLANLHTQLLDWTGFSLDKSINNRSYCSKSRRSNNGIRRESSGKVFCILDA